jgi:hypothetical protein
MMRGTITLARVIAVVLVAGCGDNGALVPKDGGVDAGAKPTHSGGKAGGTGGSTAAKSGSAGSAGSDAGTTGSTKDEDGGPGTPTTAGDGGAKVDGGGSPAAGSMDASASDAGRVVMPGPGCGGLMKCCAALPDPDRMSCELIAANADDATCNQFQQLSCTPPTGDAGVRACVTLNQCCETLPRGSLRVACATTVMSGTLLACDQVTAAFCPPGGNPNACAALSACCDSLPPPRRSACNMVVQQGLAASCETVRATLCP